MYRSAVKGERNARYCFALGMDPVKTPFIGALCNCDRDCMAYRTQVASDLMQVMFKAEYIACIDALECMGCRNCLKLCQFGAIEYSPGSQVLS